MHPYLIRLGIGPEVDHFFRPFYSADEQGNLFFCYGKDKEVYGLAFHRVPLAADCWMAGNFNFSQVRFVVLCGSAMDALSWLKKKIQNFSCTDQLLFISTGAGLTPSQISWINRSLQEKEFLMIYGKDLLSKLTGLKMAAGIRKIPIEVYAQGDSRLLVRFREKNFSFSREAFSLSAFEKASGFRFQIPASQPRFHHTFFDELKAAAGLTI